jgi:hypothetical protein
MFEGMIMKHLLWMAILLGFSLFGCIPLLQEQNLDQQTTFSSITMAAAAEPTTPVPVRVTDTPVAVVTYIATPQPTPTTSTATAIQLPTDTPIPDAPTTTTLEQRCSTAEAVQVEQTDLTQGLVFVERGEMGRRIKVLGSAGLQNPAWLYPYPDDNTSSIISLNREWIGFKTNHEIDRERNIYSVSMKVTNWANDREFRAQFDNLILSRFTWTRWINDSQIIFPLAHESELFRWLVWSPFSGEEEMLSVELPDISERQRFLEYAYPGPDPLLELVVYPCEACDEAEYAVKHLQTGETAWFIDLGPSSAHVYRSHAYWSPDGQYVTVIGGEFLNRLLFFNREGDKLYEIALPLLDDPGGLMIFNWSWSPNSNYLAFLRVTGAEGLYEDTLTYVDVQSGQVVDLCINARTGIPIWSPDSTKIAFSQQIQSGESPRLISIVDIHSGDVIQLYDAHGHSLMSWIDLPHDK